MRNKFGGLLMVMGTALVLGALALFLYNQKEANDAKAASEDMLPQLKQIIAARQDADDVDAPEDSTAETMDTLVVVQDPSTQEMTVEKVNGFLYVGYLSIPALQLELPVATDWNYGILSMSACLYAGTTYADDLVIMAHNFSWHFGRLHKLTAGDTVTFTDMDGVTAQYEVVAVDILAPTAVDEVTSGEYDLTLFTCTYGGQSRVTVYCDRVKSE